MSVKLRILFIASVLLAFCAAGAQEQGRPIPQGSSLPEGSLPGLFSSPGYLEFGGSYFNLSGPNPNWADAYIRGLVSGGSNVVSAETDRQNRYGDTGWYYSFGWTHVWSENWYSELDFGSSTVGGFFLPKARVDALIHRKLLSGKRLVLSAGGGYDKSKTINSDYRGQIGGMYYFERPWIVQGDFILTRAAPGNIVAPSALLSVTEGHDKEHYVSFTANFGREGYEIVNVGQAVVNFGFQDYSLNWRQWVGPNWGFTVTPEHEEKPFYHRNGGTVGLFFNF
jgi:YaiO family outer membrane protein